jgi:hypothetical protein
MVSKLEFYGPPGHGTVYGPPGHGTVYGPSGHGTVYGTPGHGTVSLFIIQTLPLKIFA